MSETTSRTQSSTVLFAGLLSPMPLGGEMAGAMFFIIKAALGGEGLPLNASAAWPRKICASRARHALALKERAPFTVSMFGVATSDDYRPVGWVGRYPIYVTTLLIIVHVAC